MLPGPVFTMELVTTARRRRYFVLRALFGTFLLYLLWQSYESMFRYWGRSGRQVSVAEMANFAQGVFISVAVTQGIAVLVLTPVFFAGVIADEKQRKTLHYLLASSLSSAEIVLGKLSARFLHVLVLVSVGLPIISLMTLFGGVPPDAVAGSYAATLTTAFFLASLSLLVSTQARRTRDAIIVVYLLEIAWLSFPAVVEGMVMMTLDGVFDLDDRMVFSWVDWVASWVDLTNPFRMGWALLAGRAGGAPLSRLAWMMGAQVVIGLVFLALAVARLRPVFQRQGSEPARTRVPWASRLRRPRALPECGDDPMRWKELHVGRPAGLVRRLSWLCIAVGLLVVGYFTIYLGWHAVGELLVEGYWDTGTSYYRRGEFNALIRTTTTIVYVLWTLALAVAAGSGITGEKEEDTWISLLTTMLTPREIIVSKMVGAVWRLRLLIAVVVVLGVLGLLLGALHPFGALAMAVTLATFTWFTAALGTHISLNARNTTRATVWTVAILVIVNGGYLMCCIPVDIGTMLVLFGCTPFIVAFVPVSIAEVSWFFDPNTTHWSSDEAFEGIGACMIGVVVYGIAAFLLTISAIDSFDRAVDRPRRVPGARLEARRPARHEPSEAAPDEV